MELYKTSTYIIPLQRPNVHTTKMIEQHFGQAMSRQATWCRAPVTNGINLSLKYKHC